LDREYDYECDHKHEENGLRGAEVKETTLAPVATHGAFDAVWAWGARRRRVIAHRGNRKEGMVWLRRTILELVRCVGSRQAKRAYGGRSWAARRITMRGRETRDGFCRCG